MTSTGQIRQRGYSALLILGVIVLGLAVRSRHAAFLPVWFTKDAGDALWALCVYLTATLLRPTAPLRHRALAALLFAFAIEFSQLYHAPWIESLRHIRLCGLILGYGFHSGDLLCYAVGIAAGALGEWWMVARRAAHLPVSRPQ
ncbi:MAG TPA: DUF2809 domain-containing protein [Armatimonadota bacterium]|jgi:hypothetical protein